MYNIHLFNSLKAACCSGSRFELCERSIYYCCYPTSSNEVSLLFYISWFYLFSFFVIRNSLLICFNLQHVYIYIYIYIIYIYLFILCIYIYILFPHYCVLLPEHIFFFYNLTVSCVFLTMVRNTV